MTTTTAAPAAPTIAGGLASISVRNVQNIATLLRSPEKLAAKSLSDLDTLIKRTKANLIGLENGTTQVDAEIKVGKDGTIKIFRRMFHTLVAVYNQKRVAQAPAVPEQYAQVVALVAALSPEARATLMADAVALEAKAMAPAVDAGEGAEA